jgi:hypothetical protein
MKDASLKKESFLCAVQEAARARRELAEVLFRVVPVGCFLRVEFRSGCWSKVKVMGYHGGALVRVRNVKTRKVRTFNAGQILRWEYCEQEEGAE